MSKRQIFSACMYMFESTFALPSIYVAHMIPYIRYGSQQQPSANTGGNSESTKHTHRQTEARNGLHAHRFEVDANTDAESPHTFVERNGVGQLCVHIRTVCICVRELTNECLPGGMDDVRERVEPLDILPFFRSCFFRRRRCVFMCVPVCRSIVMHFGPTGTRGWQPHSQIEF